MRTPGLTLISSPNTSPTLRLYASASVNCMVSGRGVTWGQTLAPRASASSCSWTTSRCFPLDRAKSGQVKGRPTRGCQVKTSGYSHCQPGCGQDHALAGLAHRHEQGLDLVHLGEPAGHGLAVDAPVGEREAGGQAGRPHPHGLVDELAHAFDLLGGGGPLVGGVTHDVEAQGGVTDVGGEVEGGAPTAHQVQVVGERLELPGDSGRERVGVHPLDVLERVHDHVVVLGSARGDGEPAVAGHHRGDPVVGRRLQLGVPEDLGVEVGVDVDEARGDDASGGVEFHGTVEPRADGLDHALRSRSRRPRDRAGRSRRRRSRHELPGQLPSIFSFDASG